MPTVNDSAAANQGVETDDKLHIGGLLNGVAGAFAWLPNVAISSTASGDLYRFASAGQSTPETPQVADFLATLTANPNIKEGDAIEYTTPLGRKVFAFVFEDFANPGNLTIAPTTYYKPIGTEFLVLPPESAFVQGHVIQLEAGANAGAYKLNGAGTAWIPTEQTTAYVAGGGGGGEDILPSLTDPTGVAAGAYDAALFNGALYPKQADGNFGPSALTDLKQFVPSEILTTSPAGPMVYANMGQEYHFLSADISANDISVELPEDIPVEYGLIVNVVRDSRVFADDAPTTSLRVIIGDGTTQRFYSYTGQPSVDGSINVYKESYLIFRHEGLNVWRQHAVMLHDNERPAPVTLLFNVTETPTQLSLIHQGVSGSTGIFTEYGYRIVLVQNGGHELTISSASLSGGLTIVDPRGDLDAGDISGGMSSLSINALTANIDGDIDIFHYVIDSLGNTKEVKFNA